MEEVHADTSNAIIMNNSPHLDIRRYLFGQLVINIQQDHGVWELTPHGQSLGDGMTKAHNSFVGKSVIEIGTGTGVHAIAALKLGAQYIDVTDIDEAALECARKNATLNDVQYRNITKHDWMDFDPHELYDTVLCNPPFCKVGSPDRRWFIRQMISTAPRFLRQGGHLIFCQSSMANFVLTENELTRIGFAFNYVHISRSIFRDYYFTEPNFIDESRRVENGFQEIKGFYFETLRVYLCTITHD